MSSEEIKKAERHFKVKQITKIADLISGEITTLPISDLSIERDGHIIQSELVSPDEPEIPKTKIKPGIFDLIVQNQQIVPAPMELAEDRLMESFSNAQLIVNEFEKFFSRLSFYEELGFPKRRGLLLFGPQGTGKSKSINQAIKKMRAEDEGSVIINWNTSMLSSEAVNMFFKNGVEYTEDCTNLVIIIEDIGTNAEGYGGARVSDSTLLNFLDGVGITFPLPTFIVATTNYASNLPANLIDRPGRFDEWLRVGFPSSEERIVLAEFISKSKLSADDKHALSSSDCDEYSIAHIKEMMIRSKRDGIALKEVIQKLAEHKRLMNNDFTEKKGLGLGAL